jgi:hypothetical protein
VRRVRRALVESASTCARRGHARRPPTETRSRCQGRDAFLPRDRPPSSCRGAPGTKAAGHQDAVGAFEQLRRPLFEAFGLDPFDIDLRR